MGSWVGDWAVRWAVDCVDGFLYDGRREAGDFEFRRNRNENVKGEIYDEIERASMP